LQERLGFIEIKKLLIGCLSKLMPFYCHTFRYPSIFGLDRFIICLYDSSDDDAMIQNLDCLRGGLAVVKRMTGGLGAVIFVSEEGKGTTFIVRLPLQELKGKYIYKNSDSMFEI
jgi:hypothetical protein